VVFGALAGWRLLGEPLGQRRTVAATIMFAGVALIAAAG
jgi:drug/metabolite transporter (DMT)-like permease